MSWATRVNHDEQWVTWFTMVTGKASHFDSLLSARFSLLSREMGLLFALLLEASDFLVMVGDSE